MVEMPGREFKHATIPAAGFTLDYAIAGPAHGKTIVSLPGSAGLEMSIAKDLLAKKYRVIEINPPGWGGKTDLDRAMSQEEIGKLLAEAVDKLVSDSYVLIGTSMGGTNALWLAYHAPTRVRGIVLEGSMAPAVLEDLKVPLISKEQREAMARAVDVKSGAPSFPAPPTHPRKPWATADFFRGQMAKRGAMMRWVEVDLAASAAVAKMRELKTPILVLVGSKDGIMKPRQEETCKKELPQSRFVLVDGAEHDIQNTAPEEFVRLVEEFVGA